MTIRVTAIVGFAGKAPPRPSSDRFENPRKTNKNKKARAGLNRFGLWCLAPDWQHWQLVRNV